MAVGNLKKVMLFVLIAWQMAPINLRAESNLDSLLRAAEQKEQANLLGKSSNGSRKFSWNELWLELPPETVLVTENGRPFIYVDEFNQCIKDAFGDNLSDARTKALNELIETKLVASLAKEEGYQTDSFVVQRVSKAKQEIGATFNRKKREDVSDSEIKKYYNKNIDLFKLDDNGALVLFVVTNELKEAKNVLTQIKNGKKFEELSFSKEPVSGSLLPLEVREGMFYLEPGQVSEVIPTPAGFFIAKLVARNDFDNFKVSAIVKNNKSQCLEVLEKINKGEKFEDFVADKEQLTLAFKELPLEVQKIVPSLEINAISEPISTPMGCFLVRVTDRWSEANILNAVLIRTASLEEGESLWARIKNASKVEFEENEIEGKNLNEQLIQVAKHLNISEYSKPVKTPLGYYLVKVLRRERKMYLPFEAVKGQIRDMIMADSVSDKEALKYYNSHKGKYTRTKPTYIVDVILAQTRIQAEKILEELTQDAKGNGLFSKYQKDLKSVSAELLSAECLQAAKTLKQGQVSSVLFTPTGFLLLRLNKKIDISTVAFNDVKYDIKSVLAQEIGQKDERDAELYVSGAEESALAVLYYKKNYGSSQVETVSDKEGNDWWWTNKDNYAVLDLPDMMGKDVVFADPKKTMLFKKANLLLARYKERVQNLYYENNVVVYNDLLR